MSKKKKIVTLMMCLAMACASAGTMSACDAILDKLPIGNSSINSTSVGNSSVGNSSSNSSTPSIAEFKVKFNTLGGTSVSAQTVKNGAKATKPADPTRDGYNFVEWQLNGKAYDFDSRVTGDITLVAKWEKAAATKFTVSFVVEGEETPFYTAEVEDGKKVTAPTDVPTRQGYIFDGWTLNGVAYDFETPVVADVTLTAKWVNAWTVTFDVAEGTPVAPVSVKDGETVVEPTDIPTREGYVFDGWTLNGAAYNFETPVVGNITLTAKWVNAWTVTFDVGEGTPVAPVSVKDGETVVEPTDIPTREGYTFEGWTLNGVAYNFETPVTGDLTLTAAWKASVLNSNQIGVHAFGWNQTTTQFLNIQTDDNGTMLVSTTFKGDPGNNPALVLRNIYSKAYYETLIAAGDTHMQFKLAVEGDVTDLYVFGKKLNTFPKINGVYNVSVDLQVIVDNYDTIGSLGMTNKATNDYFDQMFIAWKSTDWATRNYVFTISDTQFTEAPLAIDVELAVDFAEGSEGWIEANNTTTLVATTNMDASQIEWTSSDEAIATVENGVVTALKGGEVTITAMVMGVSVSKTVSILGEALYSDQIGVRINGWNFSSNADYFNVVDNNGDMTVTTKFQANGTYSPALIIKNMHSKAYYEALIAKGHEQLVFNLKVEGDVTDLYVFGKALSTFPEENGVYAIKVNMQQFVTYYDTMYTIATSGSQVGISDSLSAKFITWKSPADDWASVRNYVFTISNVATQAAPIPTLSVEFAAGNEDWIEVNGTTTLVATTNMDEVVWTSSDNTIATVENGVVTALRGGEVTITATVADGVSASKTVSIIGNGLYSNQIGVRINGWNMTGNADYFSIAENNGEIRVTTKFIADNTYNAGLIIRNMYSKAYYETLIAKGYEQLVFNLKVEGDVTDLYVFGKPLSVFPQENGVYAIRVNMQQFVTYYDTMYKIATSGEQVGQASSLSAKFIVWKTEAEQNKAERNYVFTISNVAMQAAPAPTLSVEFAAGNEDWIEVNGTTTLVATTNMDEVVWSSSDETIATVENGVVTALRGGEVTITATVGEGVSASKTVSIIGNGLYSNQIGVRINGWNMTGNADYFSVAENNGEMTVTTKFIADNTYNAGLIIRNMYSKAYYETLIAKGNEQLVFNLKVEGDVTDLYVFGKPLSVFPQENGVYAITINVQQFVTYYDTMYKIATSGEQVGQASSLSAKFIAWKTEAEQNKTERSYVFTISNMEFKAAPAQLEVGLAAGNKDVVEVGKTTTLLATSDWDTSFVVWSVSDETIATVKDGVVTALRGGEVTITATIAGESASMTVYVVGDGLYSNQIGIHAYGWNQTSNASYFNMEVGENGEMVVTAKLAGSTTHYPAVVLRELYSKAYYEKLIADGYAKLTLSIAVGGDNAADVSDLYVFGKKLSNFAKNTDGEYQVVVDLQYMVDNYAKVSGIGTSVEAKNAEVDYMFLAWKSTDWTARNYVFTISNAAFRKGVLFSDNIGMRVNGWNMTTNTTYMTMDTGANGEMTINANWQAYQNFGPALVLRNMKEKSYYQGLIDNGYTYLSFDLKVGGTDAGKLDDIHILGSAQKVSACEQVNGVYKINVPLDKIVYFYDNIVTLDTSGNQVGKWDSRSALLLAWRFSDNFATVPAQATRNYIFTISNTAFV